MSEAVRINKYLSENGYCSRREADRLIQSGNVFINDRPAMLGDRVSEYDRVRVQGRDKKQRPVYVHLLVNKPPGIYALELVDFDIPLYQVGHFDFDDEGLVILTNDKILATRLEHPRHAFEREYVVQVDGMLAMQDIKKLQNGMKLGNKQTQPAQVRKMDESRFAIMLKNGDQH